MTISSQMVGCALIVAYPMTSASIATTAATGKSPTDHVISESIDKDCSILRVIVGNPICEKRLKPHEVPIKDNSRQQKLFTEN